MAPPRGGDCNFLKSFVITRTRTGPLASSQLPHRAPINKHKTEWKTGAIHAPKTNWKWPIWEIGMATLNRPQEYTQQEEQWRKINKSQLSCHLLDLHSVSVVVRHASALVCGAGHEQISRHWLRCNTYIQCVTRQGHHSAVAPFAQREQLDKPPLDEGADMWDRIVQLDRLGPKPWA